MTLPGSCNRGREGHLWGRESCIWNDSKAILLRGDSAGTSKSPPFKKEAFLRSLSCLLPDLQVCICCQLEASRPSRHSPPRPPFITATSSSSSSSCSPPVWRTSPGTGPPRLPAPGSRCAPAEGPWLCPPCWLQWLTGTRASS